MSTTEKPTLNRKTLMDRISALGQTEHAEIFRILKKHGVPHTQNKNGVFVNITTVSDDIVQEVSEFVSFCSRNNKELEDYDKRLNQCKLYQNLDCMSDKVEVVEGEEEKPVEQPSSSMQRFLESLENSMDTQGRRQHQTSGSIKYAAAKKKYSKRIMAEVTRTRGGAEESTIPELKSEPYVAAV